MTEAAESLPADGASATDFLESNDRAMTTDTEPRVMEAVAADAVALIGTLPISQAQALLLTVVMDLDFATAARVLDRPVAAVSGAAIRGRQRLAQQLKEARSKPLTDDTLVEEDRVDYSDQLREALADLERLLALPEGGAAFEEAARLLTTKLTAILRKPGPQTKEERRADLVLSLRRAGEEYLQVKSEAEAEVARRRQSVETAIWLALDAGATPTEVADASPFTPAYTRRVARSKGIPPGTRGPKPTPTDRVQRDPEAEAAAMNDYQSGLARVLAERDDGLSGFARAEQPSNVHFAGRHS